MRKCSSTVSRDAAPSGRPCDHAKPELVVASALKPRPARNMALPTSQGFGMTKHPWAWSTRKSARFCSIVLAMASGRDVGVALLLVGHERDPPVRHHLHL